MTVTNESLDKPYSDNPSTEKPLNAAPQKQSGNRIGIT